MESNYHAKEKFSYSLWEPFTNRGKHPHIKFTFTKNKNDMHLVEPDLIIRTVAPLFATSENCICVALKVGV